MFQCSYSPISPFKSSIQIQVLIEIPYCISRQAVFPAFHQIGYIDVHWRYPAAIKQRSIAADVAGMQ